MSETGPDRPVGGASGKPGIPALPRTTLTDLGPSLARSHITWRRYTVSMHPLTRYAIPGLMVLLSVATASVSPAQLVPRSKPPALHSYAVTSLHAILSDPGHYQFRLVRIRGVVQSIAQVPQQTACGGGVGYQIRVKDESGELTVIDLGPCGRGNRGPVLPETLAGGEPIDVLILVQFTNTPRESPNPPQGLLQWLERTPSHD